MINMGASKTQIFSTEQNYIASLAKALGHPARVAILQHLLEKNTCICGDLVDEIGLAQPTISQHLRELKQIGLIKGQIDGTKVCYCIDYKTYNTMMDTFTQLLGQSICTNTNCCKL